MRGANGELPPIEEARSPRVREAVTPTVCLGPPRIDPEGLMTTRDRTIPASAINVPKIRLDSKRS